MQPATLWSETGHKKWALQAGNPIMKNFKLCSVNRTLKVGKKGNRAKARLLADVAVCISWSGRLSVWCVSVCVGKLLKGSKF